MGKQRTHRPVFDCEELVKAMAGFQAAVEPVVPVGRCWHCKGCTGNNPPSEQTCLIEGCGLVRASEVSQVVDQLQKTVQTEEAGRAEIQKKIPGGRKCGEINTCLPLIT